MRITLDIRDVANSQLIPMFNMAWKKRWEPKDREQYNNKLTIHYCRKLGRR